MRENPTISIQKDFLSAFRRNDSSVLKDIYIANYPKIELLVLTNSGTKDQAKDVYQEAFLAVWQNIKQDKFHPKTNSSLNAYLYTIAKNKWMDYLRSQGFKKTSRLSELENFQPTEEENNGIDDDILKDKRLEDVMLAFKHLGEACKSLLRMFYFEKQSMNSIAKELHIDSASTRNKKYRCMQKLKDLALNNY